MTELPWLALVCVGTFIVGVTVAFGLRSMTTARPVSPPLDVHDAQALLRVLSKAVGRGSMSFAFTSVTIWGDGEVAVSVQLGHSTLVGRGPDLPLAVEDLVKQRPDLAEALSAWRQIA